jgi:flagellar hook protein FlgE
MMRSLYSGVSGLRVHQTKMDVIGNNIANVNTVGFKASSVTFSDIFYQTIQSATGPNAATGAGGQNAKQIGLGANVASIVASITQTGGAQRTDNPYDVMISGDSFFVVNSGGTNYFTKAGAFGVDSNGTLTTPSGATVMGWQVDPKDNTKTVASEVSPLQIMSPENLYSAPQATTNTYISGNIDYKDTQIAASATGKMINLGFYDSLGQGYTAKLKVNQSSAQTNQYGVAVTDITDANGKSIFVKDNGATPPVYSASTITGFQFGGVTYTATVNTTTGAVTLAPTGTADVLQFDATTGKFQGIGAGTPPTGKGLDLKITANPNPFKTVNVDFSSVTMYESAGTSTLEPERGSITDTGISDLGSGRKAGSMTGIAIDTAGKIYGKYDNGDSRLLGQIAVASFANPAGLESVGGNMFAQTQNSGSFDGVGHDVTSDGGSFTTGVLEMSNVDLSAQFTDMITTQRGFQANSRVITTSDTLLEELINLKR